MELAMERQLYGEVKMDEFDKEQANNREYVLSMVKQDGKLLDLASERYKMTKKL